MIVFNFNIAQASIIPIKADSPLSLIRIEYCPPRVPISFSCRAQIRIPRLKSRSRRRSVVRASYTVIRDYVCSGYYLTRIGQPKNSVAESTWIRRKAFFSFFTTLSVRFEQHESVMHSQFNRIVKRHTATTASVASL